MKEKAVKIMSCWKEAGIEPLHLLHAYSHQLGVVIGQMECGTLSPVLPIFFQK